MSESHYGFRFFLLLLILAVNAFFASAEVALVSVRESRLKQLAEEGQAGAQSALYLLAHPRLAKIRFTPSLLRCLTPSSLR